MGSSGESSYLHPALGGTSLHSHLSKAQAKEAALGKPVCAAVVILALSWQVCAYDLAFYHHYPDVSHLPCETFL